MIPRKGEVDSADRERSLPRAWNPGHTHFEKPWIERRALRDFTVSSIGAHTTSQTAGSVPASGRYGADSWASGQPKPPAGARLCLVRAIRSL